MVYTVVIVDDEIHAIQHLRRMLESQVPQCVVAGTFTDPREALAADCTLVADIVIVDIMMPTMTGLEFARQLLGRSPHIRVVLLTAYRDFEFAKQAVGIGVHDYWVKHELRGHNISTRMADAMAAVDRATDRRRGEEARQLLEALAGERPFHGLFGAEPVQSADYFLLYLASAITIRDWPPAPDVALTCPASLVGLQVAAGRVRGRDPALRRERFQELCAALERHITGPENDPGARILLSDLLPESSLGPDLHRRCLAAVENCRFGSTILRVAGNGLLDLLQPDLPARLRMEQEYFLPMAGYVEQLDLPPLLEDLAHLWQEPTLAAGNRQALEYARDMLWELATAAGAEEPPPPDCDGPDELGAFFTDCFRGLLGSEEDQSPSMKVRRICAYIHRCYSGDLRLGTLTREFAISGDYLRKLFRDEMGQTLSEYITRVRMDKARQLLKTGDYKIYEIAEMVGYHSAQYFSQAFYKATGRYPTDLQ